MFESLAFRLFFLRGFVGAGSAGTGVDGFVERFAVGLVDRFEFPALAGAQPQLADDLFAGRLCSALRATGWPCRCVPPHRWPAGLRPRRARFRGRRGPSHGALQPRRVRSPGRSSPWPAGLLPWRVPARRRRRSPRRSSLCGPRPAVVPVRCRPVRYFPSGANSRAQEEKQDMFHS